MNLITRHIFLFSLTTLFACSTAEKNQGEADKKVILYASREAPLGWLYFKLYSDSTFTATSTGLRNTSDYTGTYKTHFDTLFLTYNDSIPKAFGQEMLIEKFNLRYLDIPGGLGIDTLQIDLEAIIKSKPVDSLEIKELKLMQGVWEHSEDKKSIVSISQNFWSDYYDNQPIDETDGYRIWWKRKLSKIENNTSQNSSFLVLTNKNDTMSYEILGITDSTMSLMYLPSGRIHLYKKKI